MFRAGRIVKINFRATLLATTVFSFIILTCFHLQSDQTKDISGTTPTSVGFGPSSIPSVRHVTKSLSELGHMDELNSHVLFLNSIPRSGSELLVLLLQWLQGWNSFRHIRLKGGEKMLDRERQEEFVEDMVGVMKHKAIPLTFDRHLYFVNFSDFNRQSPTYINLIRDPIDMVVSRFHYFMSIKKPNNITGKRTLEHCIKKKLRECHIDQNSVYDLTIPYFCGQHPHCLLFNDESALRRAQVNVERYFPVVGILEELNSTLALYETKLPYFFKGVQDLYYRDLLQPHRGKYKKKIVISDFVRKYLKKKLKTEYEFYEWTKRRLFEQLRISYGEEHQH